MNVLLTFTGFHDPFFKGLVGQEEQPGPILSLLSMRSFDRIYLFNTPKTKDVDAFLKIVSDEVDKDPTKNVESSKYVPSLQAARKPLRIKLYTETNAPFPVFANVNIKNNFTKFDNEVSDLLNKL